MAYVGKEPKPKFLGQVDDLTVAGDANIDTNTLVVDSVNNRVGIGTSSPVAGFQVNKDWSSDYGSINISHSTNSLGGIGLRCNNVYKGGLIYRGGTSGAYWELTSTDAEPFLFRTNATERMRIDSSGNVGIGATSLSNKLTVNGNQVLLANGELKFADSANNRVATIKNNGGAAVSQLQFLTGATPTEAMRIDSDGRLLVGQSSTSLADPGHIISGAGVAYHIRDGGVPLILNRLTNDGTLVSFYQNTSGEGSITVSGTTVSYNGGHLARWSRLADDSKDTSIVKGTVMTNLDEMVVWSHDAVEAQDAVLDEDGNVVTEAVEAQEAYTEDNEQLNKMAISSVEGDPNVAGVFVNWDEEDDFNDMNIAMTGDMVIRIAQGTTVQRGDLLMSAGDGTAKPQGDDIVRSKTIAKVTSTHVSHTYDDGSYLVPCVLMAC